MTTDQTNNRLQWDDTADPEWLLQAYLSSDKKDARTIAKIALLCASRVAHLANNYPQTWTALSHVADYVERPDEINKWLCEFSASACEDVLADMPTATTEKQEKIKSAFRCCYCCVMTISGREDYVFNVIGQAQSATENMDQESASQCAIIRSIIPNPFTQWHHSP